MSPLATPSMGNGREQVGKTPKVLMGGDSWPCPERGMRASVRRRAQWVLVVLHRAMGLGPDNTYMGACVQPKMKSGGVT